MNHERNKAPLALMEQIIMILVFALASAVCLQGFVYSNNLSKNGLQREMASTMAQTITEYCKAESGDLDAVCQAIGGERTESGLRLRDREESLLAELELGDATDYLQRAHIKVLADENEIYSMDIAWQLPSGKGESPKDNQN